MTVPYCVLGLWERKDNITDFGSPWQKYLEEWSHTCFRLKMLLPWVARMAQLLSCGDLTTWTDEQIWDVCNAQSMLVMAAQQLSLAWIHVKGFTDLYNNPLHFCTDSENLSLWSRPADFFFPRMSRSLILWFSSQEQLCMVQGTGSFHRCLQLGKDYSISPSDSSLKSALSEVGFALLMTGKWMPFLPAGNTLTAVPAEVLCFPLNSESGGCLSSLSLLNSSPLSSIFNICG